MRIRLDYGRSGLWCDLPDERVAAVLDLAPSPPLEDPAAAIRAALARPIGTLPLQQLARDRGNAVIVVCDFTRPVPNALLLPPILEALERGGLPRERVTVLVATGTHRPTTDAERREMLGEHLAATLHIVDHKSGCLEEHVDLGTSPHGLQVLLDRTYVKADLRITVGLIEPHFMAGFSGGRKLIMPGVAALSTVQEWHSPRFLEHPRARAGVIEGNPVHEASLAAARMCPPDLVLDVTLDGERRLTGVFAGELEAAWLQGTAHARRQALAILEQPVDIAVTTCAGYPLDATFYQAVKGMVGALPVVRPGGVIIIAAECSEGVGGAHFRDTLLAWRNLDEFVVAAQRDDWLYIPDQWEVEELAKAVREHSIFCICSGIPSDLLAQLHVRPAGSVEEALGEATRMLGPRSRIAVIPRGPYVLPELRGRMP